MDNAVKFPADIMTRIKIALERVALRTVFPEVSI